MESVLVGSIDVGGGSIDVGGGAAREETLGSGRHCGGQVE